MLSRRRRVSSSSIQLVELDDENVNRTRVDTDVLRLRTSAETSTSTLFGSSMPSSDSEAFALSSGHVGSRGRSYENEQNVEDVRTDDRRRPRRPHETSCDSVDVDRRCSDFSESTSLTQQHNPHRQPASRLYENSRRRRRKSVRILDSPSIVQNPITNSPDSYARDDSETFFRTNEEPSRISATNADGRPDESKSSMNTDADVHTTDCRTSRESFEARPRLKNHEIQDFVHEHKSSRRRETISPHSAVTSTRIMTSYGKTAWTQMIGPKYRYPVLLALLLWTIMMLPQASGRQNHHRTCPGCPHQHVHTINRKAAPIESGPSDEAETPPSPDDLRLEAIKHQILTKLGLRSRPDVNRTLTSVPRHLALETLYRTEAQPVGYAGDSEGYHEGRRRDHHRHQDNEDEDSLSASSSSPSFSSSSSSSSSSSASSSSSYGQYYYAGEEYSYRNVDPGLEDNSGGRGNDDGHQASIAGRHFGDDDDDDDGSYAHGRHGNAAEEESQVEMDDFYARTSEIITFAEPGCTLNGQPLLEFPRSSVDPALEPLRIKKATLWARVELRHPHHYQHHRRGQGNQRNITLWVFRVRCGNVTHLRGKELGQHLDMVTSLSVNVNQLGWQKFDVTKVVSNWYSGHESTLTRLEKLTLLVDCTGCGSHVHVSTFGVQVPNVVEASVNAKGEQDPDRPFLVVRTDPAAVKRVRRRAIECSGAVKGQCCKQRFYVSFSQLGWDDWIIAPQGYYANYCRGDCAARHRTPDTFLNYYTHVIEEFRKMDRLAGMQPCCAPVKFSPMSLIYYGPDSNIIKRDLPKMVVDECGCP